MKDLQRVLIANRAEIAWRIIRTVQRLGLTSIVVYSDADRETLAVQSADEAHRLGTATLSDSYLNQEKILKLARQTKADAIHPGYGLLSENAEFARRVIDAGIKWIGPHPECMLQLSEKDRAKKLAQSLNIPTVPGYQGAQDDEALTSGAQKLGFPLLIKAVGGGGGRGIRLVHSFSEFLEQCKLARTEALNSFGNGDVLLEKYIPQAHHIEVQIFADQHGSVVHLGERDCSVQRRRQKLIEESPSSALTPKLREQITAAAINIARSSNYSNAGTVEFLLDPQGQFYFLEVNTRLQVEHPVTEEVTGLDLVEWQLRIAAGEKLPLAQSDINFSGHSIEARLYAEDPYDEFRPHTGRVEMFTFPNGLRTDHFLTYRTEITPFYDAMLAKVIVKGSNREHARKQLLAALDLSLISGLKTNREYLRQILREDFFAKGHTYTSTLDQQKIQKRNVTERDTDRLAAYAALGLFLISSKGNRPAWSNSQNRRALFFLRHNQKIKISLEHQEDHLLISTPLAQYRITQPTLHSTHLQFIHERETQTALFHQWGDGEIEIQSQGQSERFINLLRARSTQAAALDPNLITAPMAGVVSQILVQPHDNVQQGQVLALIEAMKMQMEMRSPRAGQVESVSVSAGSQVKNRQLLIKLKSET